MLKIFTLWPHHSACWFRLHFSLSDSTHVSISTRRTCVALSEETLTNISNVTHGYNFSNKFFIKNNIKIHKKKVTSKTNVSCITETSWLLLFNKIIVFSSGGAHPPNASCEPACERTGAAAGFVGSTLVHLSFSSAIWGKVGDAPRLLAPVSPLKVYRFLSLKLTRAGTLLPVRRRMTPYSIRSNFSVTDPFLILILVFELFTDQRLILGILLLLFKIPCIYVTITTLI